jgi:pSer/pThr/pTyr-binding forkhead associated (FHA) protein
MKFWAAWRRAQPEVMPEGIDDDEQDLHEAQPTMIDHRRPEVSAVVVSGEVKPQLKKPTEAARFVTVLGRALVGDVSLCESTITLGRDPRQDLVLDDPSVSREHCQIRYDGQSYWVYDTGTANGTTVNGHATAAEEIMPGAEIGVGCFVVLFEPTDEQLKLIDYRIGRVLHDELRAHRETHFLSHEEIARIRRTVQDVRAPHLRLLGDSPGGGKLFSLRSRSVLGRGRNADIPLTGWLISRRHAEIFRDTKSFTIRRLSRFRPIYVNGERVVDQCRLGNRDLITIGGNAFQFGA